VRDDDVPAVEQLGGGLTVRRPRRVGHRGLRAAQTVLDLAGAHQRRQLGLDPEVAVEGRRDRRPRVRRDEMQDARALQGLGGGCEAFELLVAVVGEPTATNRQRLEVEPQPRTTLDPGTMSSLPSGQRTHALWPPS